MTTQKLCPVPELEMTGDLYLITMNVIDSISSATVCKDTSFVNDIPKDLDIDADPQIVASILGGMLSTVCRHAKRSCIRISAKIYGNIILIHVKDTNSIYASDISRSLQPLELLAEKIGGYVGVCSYRHKITTVAFSFPNIPVTA